MTIRYHENSPFQEQKVRRLSLELSIGVEACCLDSSQASISDHPGTTAISGMGKTLPPSVFGPAPSATPWP